MIEINKIEEFIKAYNWSYTSFDGVESGSKYFVTYYSPDKIPGLKVVIMIQPKTDWLIVSTHKLFKYSINDKDLILRFLKFNAQEPMIKWFVRDIKDEMYVNIGFELHQSLVNQENFHMGLDILTFYIDDVIRLLQENQKLSEANLTRVETIDKSSFELV